jgi:hypothetical protein
VICTETWTPEQALEIELADPEKLKEPSYLAEPTQLAEPNQPKPKKTAIAGTA